MTSGSGRLAKMVSLAVTTASSWRRRSLQARPASAIAVASSGASRAAGARGVGGALITAEPSSAAKALR